MTQGIDAYYIRVSDILQDHSQGEGGPTPQLWAHIHVHTRYNNILSGKISGLKAMVV